MSDLVTLGDTLYRRLGFATMSEGKEAVQIAERVADNAKIIFPDHQNWREARRIDYLEKLEKVARSMTGGGTFDPQLFKDTLKELRALSCGHQWGHASTLGDEE